MPNLIPCQYCDKPIAPNAVQCPHCGGIPTSRTKLQVGVVLILGLIAAGLAAYLAFVITQQPVRAPAPEVPGQPVAAAKLAP